MSTFGPHAPYGRRSVGAVGRFISRRVRVTGEAGSRRCVRIASSQGPGPAKPASCLYRRES